jgi:hypothetical protein
MAVIERGSEVTPAVLTAGLGRGGVLAGGNG